MDKLEIWLEIRRHRLGRANRFLQVECSCYYTSEYVRKCTRRHMPSQCIVIPTIRMYIRSRPSE